MPRIYNIKNLSYTIAVVVFSTSLLACGGGGSDGGSDSQSNNNSNPVVCMRCMVAIRFILLFIIYRFG